MKIKAKNPSVKSMALIIPVDGKIEIDANGIVDVSDKAAKMLVNGTKDWDYYDKPLINGNDDSNNEKSEDEVVVSGIKKMKLEEMIAMANEAGYPESEWKRFSKKDKLMAAYLIKKYNEAKLNEEVAVETESENEK